MNIYQPAQGTLSGAPAFANFANPVAFLCGAIQAASRLGADQSAKLCVQYLAPIIKNRQYNFPPLGENLVVGAAARPNEVTYSEDWMRPDYVPPPANAPATPGSPPAARRSASGQSRRRPARVDAPRRRWLDDGPPAAPAPVPRRGGPAGGVGMVALAGCGWRGLNSIAVAGNRGARPRLVHDSGATARRGHPRAELPRAGRRRYGRQRHQDRAAGLACPADHQAQRRRRPAGQRDRDDRPNQPARFAAHRTGPTHRRPTQGQVEGGIADPAVVGRQLPVDRADARRDIAVAQRRWDRADSGHHPGAQHRIGRACRGPTQPDRAAGHVHRPCHRPDR